MNTPPNDKEQQQPSKSKAQEHYGDAVTQIITQKNNDNDHILKQSHPYPFLKPPKDRTYIGEIAHYQINETIGQGGMGYVFKAHDSQLLRTVALKVMKPELSHQLNAKARFLHEARSMASINSNNVAIIHQVGEENDIPYLAMEFLEGQSMENWIKSHSSIAIETIIKWGIQICEGLIPAHQKNLIHRDIKPANLWIEDPDERIKILDFGLAYALDANDHFTQTGCILGTLEYMSPEQIEAGHIDARSDLFSLGCVLYQLASQRSPFFDTSQIAVVKNIATITPLPLQQLRADIPRSLSLLISELLCKSPEARPVSAAEVCLRLKKIARQIEDPTLNKSFSTVVRNKPLAKNSDNSSSKNKSKTFIISLIVLSALFVFYYVKQSPSENIVSELKKETAVEHSDNHLNNNSYEESSYKESSYKEDVLSKGIEQQIENFHREKAFNNENFNNASSQDAVEEPVLIDRPFNKHQAIEPYNRPPPRHLRAPHLPPPKPQLINEQNRNSGPHPRPPR